MKIRVLLGIFGLAIAVGSAKADNAELEMERQMNCNSNLLQVASIAHKSSLAWSSKDFTTSYSYLSTAIEMATYVDRLCSFEHSVAAQCYINAASGLGSIFSRCDKIRERYGLKP